MTQNDSHDREEAQLATLLRTVDTAGAPPADAALLDALRARTCDVFAQGAEHAIDGASGGRDLSAAKGVVASGWHALSEAKGVVGDVKGGASHNLADRETTPLAPQGVSPDAPLLPGGVPPESPTAKSNAHLPARSRMVIFSLRSLTALAATAAAVIACLTFWPANSLRGAVPFSAVLEDLRGANTLQLQVTKEGRSAQVWIRAPGLVRWEDSPQQYRIAAGSRLWKIDETANTVAAGDSPWFLNPQRQVDLLGLLDVGINDATALRAARPEERATYDGRECFVYRVDLPAQNGRVAIEAFADVEANQLVGIVAWPAGAARRAGPPLAELRLVAVDAAVDESKFVVAKSLTEDGRIGSVRDAQGVVVLRPMLAQRWTPIGRETLLRSGDWLRTDPRGANAVLVRLSSDCELTLGPGTLVECISPSQARLHAGEVQIGMPKRDGVPFELLAPRSGSQRFASTAENAPGKPASVKQLWRVDRNERLVEVRTPPQWLAGFEGASNKESLGSLIVQLPDGRNEPLSVGYHKVQVEIRDQIARTTIEESFVNHTAGRLEGVFHFPLPQDASISGFGMWIGNDLIEADVVEKQRAREIYETILREKRDPGLLEWTGGNLFKARVFPIEANSEKRIKIVYTQVLPLRANRYRYTYGLRSELLQARPLRELSLSVTVNSALPLKNVTCPTHTVRTERTEHSAQVDFAAQEYTPNRDFEVVCEIDGRNSDVVVVPHRRGAEGYFLLQVTPPGAEGNRQREVLPEGKPLTLVLLCDTSASMDAEKRRQQAEFVATVLASLGVKDRFLLAAADVGTVWVSPEPLAPTPENVAKAREFLAQRMSLGWTDLERALTDCVKNAPADAHVVYIGDGIVSAGETDPASFVKRVRRLIAGADTSAKKLAGDAAGSPTRSFHAVAVGNTYEAVVLQGIAAAGEGSVRTIGGEQTPATVARELLNEIAQPGLRNLHVEFRGLKVAAVYPEQLPNVPAGTQQILVGRYLPTGADQQGEVIVTGTRGSETVRYAAKIALNDAEEGNSFIPRLWARAHLDQLLRQGPGDAVRDEIIAMSEAFHIITPYTSLLVLETDADRERFGVKRRYELRDGERFFAEGKGNANYELLRQQMKRAGDWRLGLRRQVLRELATLSRDPRDLQRRVQTLDQLRRVREEWGEGWEDSGGPGLIEPFSINLSMVVDGDYDQPIAPNGTLSVEMFGGRSLGGAFGDGKGNGNQDFKWLWGTEKYDAPDFQNMPLSKSMIQDEDKLSLGMPFGESGIVAEDEVRKSLFEDAGRVDWNVVDDFGYANAHFDFEAAEGLSPDGFRLSSSGLSSTSPSIFPGRSLMEDMYESKTREVAYTICKPVYEGYYRRRPDYTSWLTSLFPALPRAPRNAPATKNPRPWPAEAVALSKSLLRAESLRKLTGGVEIRRTAEWFDPRWNRRTGRTSDLALVSPTAWLTRPLDAGGHTLVNYCNANERGVFSLALLLGQTRKPADKGAELQSPPLSLSDWSQNGLHESYREFVARVEPAGEHQTRLTLVKNGAGVEFRLLIDTTRHVLLRQETFEKGKLTGTIAYEDFAEVGGSWWARHVVSTDAKGRKTAETTLDVKALAPPQVAQRMSDELAARQRVQFLHLPGPSLKTARQRVADGSAGFDDRIAMILHDAAFQQWDEMLAQLEAAEKLAPNGDKGDKPGADKPGMRWIRTAALAAIRRNEEARQRLLGEARTLAAAAPRNQDAAANARQDEVYLADFVLDHAQSVASSAEYLEFVQLLRPVFERQPAETNALARWQDRLVNVYDQLDRAEDALALRRVLAEKAPWDVYRQTDYARRLLQAGQPEAAYQWLQRELDRKSLQEAGHDIPFEWTDSEDETLRTAYADLYRQQARWEDLLRFTTSWVARDPVYQSAYLQHLAALVYNDQFPAANALVGKWFAEGRVEGQLRPEQRARLDAAISFAQGNCYNLSFQRMDARWFEPLAATARFFSRHKHHFDVTQRILEHRFSQSDACDRLRGYFLALLRTELDQLTPEQISTLVSWTMSGRIELAEPLAGRTQISASEIPDAVWKQIAAQLRKRWEKLPSVPLPIAEAPKADAQAAEAQSFETRRREIEEKHSLGESLRTIYANRFDATELLPFLRARIASAPAEYKASYVSNLFEVLLGRAWTEDIETEAFQLLRQLTAGQDSAEERLSVQLPALYRLVDAMIANRYARADKEFHDSGKVDQLTRTELAKKRAEQTKAARAGVAARLAAEAERGNDSKGGGPLAPWLRIEQAYLDVQLNQHLPEVEKQCWQILGEVPPAADSSADGPRAADATDESDGQSPNVAAMQKRLFDALLGQRAFATAMNLAARRNAAPESTNRALKYIDAGIARGGEAAALWRATKFQLLIALDRPDDLERDLRAWIRADATLSPWRKALGLLLAERGRLDEAIPLFEAAEKDRLLTAADYRTLSDWYLVNGRRQDYERTRIESFKQTPERQLSRMFNSVRNRWLQAVRPLPSELDESTLFAFRALLEKSSQPENYLSQLRDLYAACRDFRLLQMLPDAVLGRSPQQIYAFLRNLQGQVLYEMRNEATADSILARIAELRERKLTPADLRALDLLEAVVERRSSEVLNQPQPHVAACLAALRRAFDRQWTPGEPRLMAGFLHSLNALHHPKLVDEQLRELRALLELAPQGSRDRLHIANDLCNALFWSYNQKDAAIGEMEAAVRAYEQAHQGRWPNADNEILGSYVHLLEGDRHYAAGEDVLQQRLERSENARQRAWLQDRLWALYNEALEHGGEVSLGKDASLFQSLVARGLKQLDAAPDENARYDLVSRLASTFGIAHVRKLPIVAESLRKFAFENMPAVLKRQQQQYNNTAAAPRSAIFDVLGPRFALQYLVERMEQYPERLEITGSRAWDAFGNEMAQRLRESIEAKLEIGDLAPRALKLTLAELKDDLNTGENRGRDITYIGHRYFWKEKAGDFAQAANEVYAEKKSDGRRAVSVAGYFWNGLHEFPRAIEILLLAQRDGVLDQSGRDQLINYLQAQKRFAESIPLLEPLVKGSPDAMSYRALLMTAYFQSQRQEQLLQLVRETDAYFHQGGRWVEGNIASLGNACLDCNLAEKAAGYLAEAIALHQRGNAGRTINDAGLSNLYQRLARAHSALAHTREAVEAASGAIVCWGPRHDRRQEALTTLKQVLAAAKDLADYVHQLDAEAAKTGQDSPILRKAIGQVLYSGGDCTGAIVQLQLAAQLLPGDKEIHEALIECYDALGDEPGAIRQLLRLIEADRFNLKLYQQLADRMQDNEAEAERAATSIIEAAPREAENHAAMAELRQKQNRWDEAAAQWEDVAKLRRLEPTGLLKLSEARMHLKHWDAARQSLETLQRTEWPARFGDVNEQIRRLREQLPK
jgi:Vault protein inter-alpha-trypsin domain/von Willebrand factor type A domain